MSAKPLNVGYFTHSNFGPSETFIYDLVKGLNKEQDINLTFINGSRKQIYPDFAVKSIQSGFAEKHQKAALRINKIGNLKGFNGNVWQMKFRKYIAKRQIENNKIPEIDVAYVDYSTSAVLLQNYFCLKNIPFIVHVHGYDITSSLNNSSYKKEVMQLLKNASYFIAASEYVKRRLILLGCDFKKIVVIPIGVPFEDIKPLSWELRKKEPPSIVFLGRLTEKKHPVALLYSFKIVKKFIPDCTLTIIGDGPLRHELELTIKKMGLSKSVKMLGSLTRLESFPILNRHWVYAQHSVTSISGDTEGFGISLAEAALHELPVVSTIHNGITENVIDGRTGYLVAEYDYEAMAERLVELIRDPILAEKMGKAGRAHIRKHCDPFFRIQEIKRLLYSASCQPKA